MTAWVSYIEDGDGDLVDINYYCSQACALDFDDEEAAPAATRIETDFAVYCVECSKLLWEGLEDDLGAEPSEGFEEVAEGVYMPWTPPREQLGFVLTWAAA